MSLSTVIIIYVIADIIVIRAFLFQRAALEIGRSMMGFDIRNMVLPSWFKFAWIPRILTWVLLSYMFYEFSWYYAVATLLIDLAITTVCPVPDGDYKYVAKKIKQWEESGRL